MKNVVFVIGPWSIGQAIARIRIPMLFVQGTRDNFGDPTLLAPVLKKLGRKVSAQIVDQADHAFHVPARSERSDGAVVTEIVDALARWTTRIIA